MGVFSRFCQFTNFAETLETVYKARYLPSIRILLVLISQSSPSQMICRAYYVEAAEDRERSMRRRFLTLLFNELYMKVIS